ncbi:hypothetical protein D1N53_24705, partial [Clostridioides difficile]
MRRRTKELGIYALLGYRKFTILSLLTFENSDEDLTEDSTYKNPESIHEIIIRKLNSESGKNFKADLS